MAPQLHEADHYTRAIDPMHSAATDEADAVQADGVLSALLELYGGSTLKMSGPSRSSASRDSHETLSGVPKLHQRRRSFIGRRLSFAQHKSINTRHELKEKRQELVERLASVLERQKFLLKFAKALLVFGSPSHRIEEQLESTAHALNIDGQFLHLPLMVICSFGDAGTRTSDTYFIKTTGDINLGALKELHDLHNEVAHGNISAIQGTQRLSKLLKAKPIRSDTQLVLINALMGFVIAPLGFSGSLLDAFAAGIFNLLVSIIQLRVAARNAAFQPIFEISVALLVSIASRGLAYTNLWCYNSTVSAGLVAVLPGMPILCGSLELGSRKMISGSVKMVFAIVFSLFLGFGISVGSDLFFILLPKARNMESGGLDTNTFETSGTFNFGNGRNGTWTFSNATMLTGEQAIFQDLQSGDISCLRQPDWPWYQQEISQWFFFLWVPAFAFLQCIASLQPIRSRDILVMWVIAIIGFVANQVANTYVFAGSDITSFMGAFLVSALGDFCARLFGGTAFTWTVPGIFFLVPGGLAAAGGLAVTSNSDGTFQQGLEIGLRMIQTAIGITVGVFTGAFLAYGVFHRKTKNGAVFAW